MSVNIFDPFNGTITDLYSMSHSFPDTQFVTSTGSPVKKTAYNIYTIITINFKTAFYLDAISYSTGSSYIDGFLEYNINNGEMKGRLNSGMVFNRKKISRIQIIWNLMDAGFTEKYLKISNFALRGITSKCLLEINNQLYSIKNDRLTMISATTDVSAEFIKANIMSLSDLSRPVVIDGKTTTLMEELTTMTDKYQVIMIGDE